MNDLTLYNSVRASGAFRVGDAIICRGVAAISRDIEHVAGVSTHVAIVQRGVDGASDVLVTQSTQDFSLRNPTAAACGVQTSMLGPMIAEYGDGAAMILAQLDDAARDRIDLSAFNAAIGAATGHVGYDDTGLVRFALHKYFPHLVGLPENPNDMFCSAYAAYLYEASHIIKGDTNYRGVSPDGFAQMALFKPAIPILGSLTVHGYSTVAVA